MAELRTLVEREMDRAGSPSYSFDDLARRRDRKQRNQRLGAGVVALALAVGVGVLFGRSWWSAQQVPVDEPTPSPVEEPTPTFDWDGMWPQATLEEAEKAQRQADAGDPGYTWQVPVDPADGEGKEVGAEIATRFVEERLGWDRYRMVAGSGSSGAWDLVFIRCQPGVTNPLYPDDPEGGNCAPTIDENRYETVSVRIEQPARKGKTGIWVVTRALELLPADASLDWFSRQYEQTVPPTEAELRGFVEAFLDARVAGRGAEEYLVAFPEVPLLYATSEGRPYERSEVRVEWGPQWPDGAFRVTVRLFAEGEAVVVEQGFTVWPDKDGRLRLGYHYGDTTENGVEVPERYGILDGQVIFYSTWHSPWFSGVTEDEESILGGPVEGAAFVVIEVWAPEPPCAASGSPASADELAARILSDPELQATALEPVTVGGVEALRLDVAPAPGARICGGGPNTDKGVPVVTHTAGGHPWSVDRGDRMRVLLLDLPGEPGRTLAILIRAPADEFEQVVAAAAPILESFVFDVG